MMMNAIRVGIIMMTVIVKYDDDDDDDNNSELTTTFRGPTSTASMPHSLTDDSGVEMETGIPSSQPYIRRYLLIVTVSANKKTTSSIIN